MSVLITESPWNHITKAAKNAKTPSFVAVAYFGQSGDKLLPLKSESCLVVDASLATVKAGVTCPSALERLHDRGVRIFSLPLLHAKVFAFDSIGFVGSTNASLRSDKHLTEAVVRVSDGPLIEHIKVFVESLCVDELGIGDLAWLKENYSPPKFKVPSISDKCYKRLLLQIIKSDEQGYSGHQVQPPSGAWLNFFGIEIEAGSYPTLRLRNIASGIMIQRSVVRHSLVMTIDIPEAVPGALLEIWQVGLSRYDYRVVLPGEADFASLDLEVTNTMNPLWNSGRKWIVTDLSDDT